MTTLLHCSTRERCDDITIFPPPFLEVGWDGVGHTPPLLRKSSAKVMDWDGDYKCHAPSPFRKGGLLTPKGGGVRGKEFASM